MKETYLLIKSRLSEGGKIILEKQNAFANRALEIMRDYQVRKDLEKLIAIRKQLEQIKNVKLNIKL